METVIDQEIILEKFNSYFSTVGQNLSNTFDATDNQSFKHYLKDRVYSSIFMGTT